MAQEMVIAERCPPKELVQKVLGWLFEWLPDLEDAAPSEAGG